MLSGRRFFPHIPQQFAVYYWVGVSDKITRDGGMFNCQRRQCCVYPSLTTTGSCFGEKSWRTCFEMGLTGSSVRKCKCKVEAAPETPCKPFQSYVEVSASPIPRKRNCTDVICLLLLLIFSVVLVGLLIYCIKYGDIDRLTCGYDRCGNVCGKLTERIGVAADDPKYTCYGADMSRKRFLLVNGGGLRDTIDSNINRICVESCDAYPGHREFRKQCIPDNRIRRGPGLPTGGGYPESPGSSGTGNSGWLPPGQLYNQQLQDAAKRKFVSAHVLKQQPILVNTKNKVYSDILLPINKGIRFRRQVERRRRRSYAGPLDPSERIDTFFSRTGRPNFYQEVAETLEYCWKELIALFFIALGFSLVLIILLLIAVKAVVIMSLLVGIVVCLVATAYLWAQWAYEKDKLAERYRYYPNSMSKVEVMYVDTYLGYAIAASVFSGIILLALLVSRRRLILVIRLFEEASRAIGDMPTLLILPWVTAIIVGALIALWFYLALWIESSGSLVSVNNVNFFYEKDVVTLVARWWNLVALFWMVQFVIACQHLVVAGAVGDWYFSRFKQHMKHPVDRSMARTVSYHLGTAAFGASLVALLHFARVVWQEVYRWFKPTPAEQLVPEGAVVASTGGSSSLVNYFLFPFTSFVAFVNRNAYVETALTGRSFIEGGKRAMRIIAQNAINIAAINSAGDFVLFMSKVAVMLSTMLVAIAMLQNKEGVLQVWVPVTLAAIFGYAVAHIFLTVYEEFIDDCDPKYRERLTVKEGQVFLVEVVKVIK